MIRSITYLSLFGLALLGFILFATRKDEYSRLVDKLERLRKNGASESDILEVENRISDIMFKKIENLNF